jgi:anaerobic carbon-monoxide dehydrogenase iron sulfur subunit
MSQHVGPFLLVNPERCLGCHTCELACAAAHSPAGTLIGSLMAGEPLSPRNRVVQVVGTKFPTQCRQCEDAPCVKVCPTGATYRTDTYTAVNPKVCIACRLCMMVCPFGAIHTASVRTNKHTKRAAIKCDLCVDRKDGPACVAACPTKAISLSIPTQVMESAICDSSERYLAALKAQEGAAAEQISKEGIPQ